MSPTLSHRLRGGDATAFLELAHATHARALAVARASAWSDDPESLLLDAYVALWLRRADVPAAAPEAWALAEVLAYCARVAAPASRGEPGGVARLWSALRRLATAVRAHAHLSAPSMGRSAS